MKNNFGFWFWIFVLLACVQDIEAKYLPNPTITNIEPSLNTPQSIFKIHGSGFIKNYPTAHKLITNNKIKLNVIAAEGDTLTVEAPQAITYGDWDLALQVRSRYLKSKIIKVNQILKIRPKAPKKPDLAFHVIKNPEEIKLLIDQDLNYQLSSELKHGMNQIQTFYYENNYQSILSEPESFYYIPEPNAEPELSIISQSPLKSYALIKDTEIETIDVSEVTNRNFEELTKYFYLVTPSQTRYLETKIKLEALFIDKIHASSEEYVVISNRSSLKQSLKGCTISDSLKIRYSFKDTDLIEAKVSMNIQGNLGLNDDTDLVTFACGDKTIDSFAYSKLDAAGFAIRI
jgi:hypothetical protein